MSRMASDRYHILSTVLVFIMAAGCSGAAPVASELPCPSPDAHSTSGQSRSLLGYWECLIIPDTGKIEFTPVRGSQMHMNALAFLEPPVGVNLALDQVVGFSPGEITVDIAISHPYPGMNFATGFDVTGILVSRGSMQFPLIDKLKFPGENDVRLLNPDGYIRWWNPDEFPINDSVKYKGYIDGLMGTPLAAGQFDATLNGYKYFATDLTDPDAPLSDLDPANRGALVPGTTCIRRYVIGYTPGNLVFNYAVDASWAAPDLSSPPIVIPDDFPLTANRPEAYRIDIQNFNNTLAWNEAEQESSGSIKMSVYVYDWQKASENMVCTYSQNGQTLDVCNFFPAGGDSTTSYYNFDIPPIGLNSADDFLLWLVVDSNVSGYDGFIPFELQSVYFPMTISVTEE